MELSGKLGGALLAERASEEDRDSQRLLAGNPESKTSSLATRFKGNIFAPQASML